MGKKPITNYNLRTTSPRRRKDGPIRRATRADVQCEKSEKLPTASAQAVQTRSANAFSWSNSVKPFKSSPFSRAKTGESPINIGGVPISTQVKATSGTRKNQLLRPQHRNRWREGSREKTGRHRRKAKTRNSKSPDNIPRRGPFP